MSFMAQLGTFLRVAARLYTMVMLSLAHKDKCSCFVYVIFQNFVIVWRFSLLLLAGHICDQ